MRRSAAAGWFVLIAGTAWGIWCAAALLSGPRPAEAQPAELPRSGLGEPVGHIRTSAVTESSGIAKSRKFENVYWTHNDSGDSARIFAIEATGKLIRVVYISRANNGDWEDIATDNQGQLYIGDFGNNTRRRIDQKVYVIDEPDPRAGDSKRPLNVPVKAVYPFRFPDGKFDCEAMFILGGRIYIVNKVYEGKTGLYLMDNPVHAKPNVLKRVSDVDELSITAADADPDGTRVALLSYNHLMVFNVPPPPASPLSGVRWSHPTGWAHTKQAEAVCFDAGGLRVTNETGDIYYLPADEINQHLPAPASRPAERD
jgi:hypothetical protein